jgi:flagella basal body P-ring formation protein FlgA
MIAPFVRHALKTCAKEAATMLSTPLLFRRCLVALALLAGFPALTAQPVDANGEPVLLNTTVSVDADVVTLGDLFSGLDERADTPIARAPEPGRQARLSAQWLSRVATAYRIDWRARSRAEEATVKRSSQRLDSGVLTTVLAEAVRERTRSSRHSIVLDNPNLSMVLPTTVPGTAIVAGLSYDPSNGRFSANLVAPDRDSPLASLTVTGRAVEMLEIPVPARRLGRGDIIRERDIEWVTLPGNQVNRNHVIDLDRIVGQSVRRSVRVGDPFRATDLETPVVVEKNSLVMIRLKTPRLSLTAQGRALDDGAQGELIRVVNTNSRTTVSAVVVAEGVVRVQDDSLPGGSSVQLSSN